MTKTPLTARKRAVTQTAAVDEVRFYRANEKPYGVFSKLPKIYQRLQQRGMVDPSHYEVFPRVSRHREF